MRYFIHDFQIGVVFVMLGLTVQLSVPASAQSAPVGRVVADTGIFSPLPLPPGNAIRGASGAPGPEYWQQRVDYSIAATLDTAAKQLTGNVTIRYTNQSPDTLRFLWLQLDQNLFRPGSTGSLLFRPEARSSGRGEPGGIEIGVVTVDSAVVKPSVDGTMMRVDLPRPLPPRGGKLTLSVAYHFPIIKFGADRMGRDSTVYELAQWYPRMAVYDDVRGWNTDPYVGAGEFYLEYGDIDYAVTVPAGYLVAGTGMLQNPADVLTPEQQTRLAQALKSDTTIHVVTAKEAASGAAHRTRQGTRTWRFRAERVRDAVWTASPQYLWDATSWDGILIHAYYRPAALKPFRGAAQMARFVIRENSTRWFRYPYPQLSVAEGPIGDMEYPMLTMIGFRPDKNQDSLELYGTLDHEIGHMWYPMLVGSDERRYAWMDEGITSFISVFSGAAYRQSKAEPQMNPLLATLMWRIAVQPVMTPTSQFRDQNVLGIASYLKPKLVLFALRSVIGADVVDLALREYTRRWAFKHPQPADFFRTVEQVSGRDLAWFWRSWFYTTATLDQAVDSVQSDRAGTTTIVLRNLGTAVMPVTLELTHADSTKQVVSLPVEIWYGGNRFGYQMATEQPVVAVRIKSEASLLETATENNVWRGTASGAGTRSR